MNNFYESVHKYFNGKHASRENKPKEEDRVLDIKGDEEFLESSNRFGATDQEFLESIVTRIEALRRYYGYK